MSSWPVAELERTPSSCVVLPNSSVDITRAPLLGEHTDEVLSSLLGYDADEIARLHEEGIV